MQKYQSHLSIQLVCLLLFAVISWVYAEEDEECGGELIDESGPVTSPGYPESPEEESRYPDNADCHWFLEGSEKTLVRVKIFDIAIELGEGGSNSSCIYDTLDISVTSVGRRSFCGGRPPEEEVRGFGKLDIYFTSDDSTGYRGFKLYYLKIDNYEPCKKFPCILANSDCELDDMYAPVCNCYDGFEGTYCEINIDDCGDDNPCLNNGTCVDGANDFSCDCPLLYEGEFCELERGDLCDPDPCENEGRCQLEESGADIECVCLDGFDGRYCEELTGCGDPGIDRLSGDRRFVYGSVINFTCVGTFELVGDAFIVCMPNGLWSGESPTCVFKEDDDGDNAVGHLFKRMKWLHSVIAFGSLFLLTLCFFIVWIRTKRPWGASIDAFKEMDREESF